MRLVEPPGDRSTRTGANRWGTPECARGDLGQRHFLESLPPTVRSALRVDLREKTMQALKGELNFCTCRDGFRCGQPSCDVRQSESRPRVLELRWDEVIDDEGRGVAARLYFTEPEHVDELTYLIFRAKYPERADWRDQQTEHMKMADDVITRHFDIPSGPYGS